ITAFDFNGLTPAVTGTVNEGAKTIALTVPYGTDVTALVPSITHTGASVFPDTGVAQNFTSPVIYTVKAADNSTQTYTVTVTVAHSTAKAITAFDFNGLTPAVTGTVNEGAKTIALTVPYGTDVTALVPSITHTGASVSPNTGEAQNFTSPVTYTVTAADSSTQQYSVTVTVALSTAKAITSFTFNGLTPAVTGTVNEGAKTIALTVPYGTDVTALVSSITHTGASVSPNTGVAQNFTSPVTYTVTAADSSIQQYSVTVKVGVSSNSNLSALSISSGTLSPAFANGTKSYTASEGHGVSSITVTPTVTDSNATVTVNGTTIASGNASGVINLNVGANIITVVVTAQDGATTSTYTVTVTRAGASSGGSSSGSSSGGTTPATTQPSRNTIVVVNGKEQNAGKETQKTEGGKSIVTVAVDNKAVESKIDEAIKANTTGTGNVIQIPVADTKSEVAKVELTGDIVKKLEENTFDVSVKRDNVEYIIPAEEFTISKVAENLGLKEKNLSDIKVEVKISKLDEKAVERYNEVAKANGAELVFPPVEFEIVAKTTNTDGRTKEQSINKFSNYVERVMEIPAGVDPSKITTGIVFNTDGTYSHVPTEVYQKDGKWYARLNSLTNSDYSVIWNPVTVKSVENHWAKDAVNDMASRLVIFNPEEFEPNKAITRADFAEYIVRALGLYREGLTHDNNFKDISDSGERTLAILIANEYGIVSGYSDGTFRGDNRITREEAMAMYQRAMKITNLVGSNENRYQNYTDYSEVSDWAKTNVKNVLSAHVFNGTSETKISPKASLTYAEAAQAIRNLLVESKLISE
ncbi:S-layer homology domain-containing protein, partial [Anaerotignum propionicum]